MNQQLIYITLTVVLALTFQPLRRLFDRLTDKVFYRDRYDTQKVLNDIGRILTSERQLDTLMPAVLREVCRNQRLNTGRFVVVKAAIIEKVHYYGLIDPKPLTIEELGSLGEKMLIADKLQPNTAVLQLLKAHNIAVSVPLYVRRQLVGYLLLGHKRSGSTFTRQDLNLLQVIAPSLAIATTNAQAFDQIDQFNKTLQREIQKATHNLRMANKNLKQLDKTKDEFISIASHQLRTPLATIEGYLSMLAHGDLGQIPLKQQQFMKSAVNATTRMSDIVTQIIDISTVSAGHFSITSSPERLDLLVAEEVDDLKPMAEAKGLTITYQAPRSLLPLMQLDKTKLGQVIANLIDNAIHYTEKGYIEIRLEQVEQSVRFTVADTGIGVPRDEQAKLFEKFFRGSNARNVRPDGSGLGLYLANQVIKAQGGEFIFKSREGEGSTFGFTIPLRTEALNPKAPLVSKA